MKPYQFSINKYTKLIYIFTTLLMLLNLSGCVSILNAANEDPIQTDPGKRSFGQYLEDEELENIVKVNIKKASAALNKSSHINVHAYNTVVLLTGEVPTEAAKKLAGETANKINRVRQVHNELTINPKSKFASRVQDSWISSKLKAKAITDNRVDADRVEIIVEKSVVFLMGKISRKEADRITELARNTGGVTKVVRVFEYLE